jgi:hypothetical protein
LDDKLLREALKDKDDSSPSGQFLNHHAQSSPPESLMNDSVDDGVPKVIVVPPLDLQGINDTPRSILRSSISGFDLKWDDIEKDAMENMAGLRAATLHLYILNGNSNIFTLMNCAWTSCLIRGTLELDPAFVYRRAIYPPRICSEKLETRFNQLKSDLFGSEHGNLTDLFRLVQELRDGTERNFVLKKFFWKSSELFVFLVRQLQRCLPHSDKSLVTECRADQLEFVLLIIETISLMLRESEIFPRRMPSLKHGGGKILHLLISMLLCQPSGVDELTRDDQILLDEFTARCTALLYELMVVAQQVSWADVSDSFFNVVWIVDIVELLDAAELKSYLERIIRQVFCLLSCTSQKPFELTTLRQETELEPDEAILVYQQFYVLDILTSYSETMLNIIQETFYEEFKFYIQLPIVEKKLPLRYALRHVILKLITSVVERILGKASSGDGTSQVNRAVSTARSRQTARV